ncbi:uncharacterized protein LOC143570754 [Bidens hawaiensis]|uniref:uncharacterized protein LOC143570754 n=1 Tax=Bidens hawaiensis TaxID=980011 RepID=UPI0040497EC6
MILLTWFLLKWMSWLEKKIAFKIDITYYDITNNYKWFTINKLTEDASIISKLEAKFDVDQVGPTQSFNNIFVGSDSQDTINFKGLLHEEDVGESSGHSDLKRKLIEVYDVHETPSEYANQALNQIQ